MVQMVVSEGWHRYRLDGIPTVEENEDATYHKRVCIFRGKMGYILPSLPDYLNDPFLLPPNTRALQS